MRNELVHVMNRGVDKRTIVLDDRDRSRFVADLYAMNDTHAIGNANYHFARSMDVGRPYESNRTRDRLVTIHAWCLMNNHYHLLLSERVEYGISLFLKKLNMGYAKYFNERYERTGALFQGKTKKVIIERDAHFLWILQYIHFNPLDYLKEASEWRTRRLTGNKRVLEWLAQYRWSSYRDYRTETEFSSLLEGSFMFADRTRYSKETKRLLKATTESPHILKNLE